MYFRNSNGNDYVILARQPGKTFLVQLDNNTKDLVQFVIAYDIDIIGGSWAAGGYYKTFEKAIKSWVGQNKSLSSHGGYQ